MIPTQKEFIDCNFWTPEENYLVQQKKRFAIAINFGSDNDVDEYLYEYDPILKKVLSLSDDLIHNGLGYVQYDLVEFDVKKRYVVIISDRDYQVSIMGQFNNKTDAKNGIKADQTPPSKNYNPDADDDDDWCTYALIDLGKMTPYFFKKGTLSNKNRGKCAKFYNSNDDF